MASESDMRYWIKLYTEILHDPKMGRLTDRQFRTCINLFALAGELDADGTLPPEADIAWKLRKTDTELRDDLNALAAVSIITDAGDGWHIRQWESRQAKAPSAAPANVRQRVTEHRQRARNEGVTTLQATCNEGVTTLQSQRNDAVTAPESDTDIDTDKIKNHAASRPEDDPVLLAIRNAYDATGVLLSKTHLDAHREIVERTGLAAWQQGMAKAIDAGKHNIPNYVARCAESALIAAQASARNNGNGRNGHAVNRPDTTISDADSAAENNAALARLEARAARRLAGSGNG